MAIILKKLDPTIQPSLIDLRDLESKEAKKEAKIASPNTTGYAQNSGLNEPLIKLGNIRLAPGQIKSLKIWQDELVPRILITLIDTDSEFSAGKFPISNILISVFIKSPIKNLKSIACDFMITNVNSFNISENQIQYTFTGDMHIPKLHANISKAFSQVTSRDALLLIATDLKLGFADNLTENTNDKMTWLMPNYSYKSAITHISKLAYSDEEQFFDCFIDRYYMLNFINVEKQFEKMDDELNVAYINQDISNIDGTNRANPEKESNEPAKMQLRITNHPSFVDTELYIKEYSIVSNHGEILKNNSLSSSGISLNSIFFIASKINPTLSCWIQSPLMCVQMLPFFTISILFPCESEIIILSIVSISSILNAINSEFDTPLLVMRL